MEIYTKRLKLAKLKKADAYLLYEYRRLKEVEKYQSFTNFTYSQAKLVVEMEAPKRKPGSYQLGIYLNEWLIGDLFFHIDENYSCMIGYTLDPRYWHHGYAYESVRASLQYLCRELNLHHFYAYIDERNQASIALVLKLGFKEVEKGIYYLQMV